MKKLLIALTALFICSGYAHSVELFRTKNVSTYVSFALTDSSGNYVSGLTNKCTAQLIVWNDATAPSSVAYCNFTPTEISSVGYYQLKLAQGEMNNDYIALIITSSQCVKQSLLINAFSQQVTVSSITSNAQTDITRAMTMQGYTSTRAGYQDNLNTGVTLSAAGQTAVQSAMTAQGYTTTRAPYIDNVNHFVSSATYTEIHTGAVGSVTAGVTVTTNNDKTGYTASTVTDKTGYSLTQTFPTNFASLFINTQGNVQISSFTYTMMGYIDAAISSRSTLTAANVWDYGIGSYVFDSSKAGGFVVQGATRSVSTSISSGTINDAVWSAPSAQFNNANTMGNKLNSAASAGDPWSTALPGAYGAGTAGSDLYAIFGKLPATGLIVSDSTGTAVRFGKLDLIDATVSSRSTLDAATVWGYGSGRTITGGTITTNSDKTGYALSQAFPANFASLDVNTNGSVRVSSFTSTIIGYIDAAISSRGTSSLTAQNVWDYGIGSYTFDSTKAGGFLVQAATRTVSVVVSSATINDAVWNATSTQFNNAGTMGFKTNSAASAGDPWGTAVPGSYPAGSAGNKLDLIYKWMSWKR